MISSRRRKLTRLGNDNTADLPSPPRAMRRLSWVLPEKLPWYIDSAQHPTCHLLRAIHYGDVTMGAMASQITSLTIVYPTVYSGADQRKHQSSSSLAFVRGIHRWPVNSPHKWPVTRSFDVSIWWRHHVNTTTPNVIVIPFEMLSDNSGQIVAFDTFNTFEPFLIL